MKIRIFLMLRLRLTSLALLPLQLHGQEIFEFLSTFDRSNQPTRSCATTGPSVTRGATIFQRDFPSFQCTPTPSNNPCDAQGGQLLLKFSPTFVEGFLNPLPQVH